MLSLLDQLFINEMGIRNARKYCVDSFNKEIKKMLVEL